ncbi:F-box/RNI-like superfamily protein [Thalictrum thalictroides]|uniref:F-box/RNI-like superfamily protein n=1 Tax=Thalictrum thalictroides TaxID=46969 RepID=A0A7J6USZ0_THATH|nr:F-box/RNI-like superfamily protein [Thalictrum thalictroides]
MFPVVEINEERIQTEHRRDVKQYNLSIKKTLNTRYSNEAERISCLPRRWRCLLPCSVSCPDDLRITFWLLKEYILTVIDKLFNREGCKVQKLHISYDYQESDAHQVDLWIRFALKHSAEELELRFSNGVQPCVEGFYRPYKLPHSLFRSKSLTNLTLSFCDLNLPSSMHVSALKRLSLEFISISSDAITSLTSSCPLLEYLSFVGCNKVSNLDIFISNPNLKFVEIWDDITTSSDTKFMIDAPYLHSLGFHVCLPRGNYCLKNLSNLAKASFYDFNTEECLGKVYGEGDCNQWIRLLDDVHHVKDIRLCSFFVQVLSREVQKLHFVYNNATCIELETKLTNWELPVISYLLKSSPKLETLIMKPGEPEITLGHDDKFGFDTKDYWNNEDFDFSSHLQNLKTVEIYIYIDPYKLSSVDEVLKRIENCYVQFELNLCNFFVQVLSMRRLKNLKPLSINASCITLESTLTEWELPGISYLFKNSPKLETLDINSRKTYIQLIDDLKGKFEDYWKRDDFDFSSLRIVEVNVYVGSYNIGDVDEVQKRIESSYVGFVSFLLRKASLLERMIIQCGEKDSSLRNDCESIIMVCKILSILPRASPRCELHII